jgi:23S rRNA-/tRNA-specific pseudouridylate synthase/uncharacterized protein (DUF3820 family)
LREQGGPIVVQKDTGVFCSHQRAKDDANEIKNMIEEAGLLEDERAYLLNALDKPTSGMVMATGWRDWARLRSRLVDHKNCHKVYETCVYGAFPTDKERAPRGCREDGGNRGTVSSYFKQSRSSWSWEVTHDEAESDGKGKYSTTYERLGAYGYWEVDKQRLVPVTHLRVTITGGHQHQIRVHLAHLLSQSGGYVVGDDTYATGWRKEAHHRLWLHNSALGIWDEGRFAACVECELAADLKWLFQACKKDKPRQLDIDHHRAEELRTYPFMTWVKGCDLGDVAKLAKLRMVPSKYSGDTSVDFAAAYASAFPDTGRQPPYLLGRLLDLFEEEEGRDVDVVEFVMERAGAHLPLPHLPSRRHMRRDTEQKLDAYKEGEERRSCALERSYDDRSRLKRAVEETTAKAHEHKRARREAERHAREERDHYEDKASKARRRLRELDERYHRLLQQKDADINALKVKHAEGQRSLIEGVLLVRRR